MKNETKTQPENIIVKQAIAYADALLEAIRASKDGIPSVHLYAAVMGHMSLDVYQRIIGALKATGKVKGFHVLTFVDDK